MAAPGENVFGALSSSSDPYQWPRQRLPGSAAGIYGYGSGTSFSSPEVAGAAALVWAANPHLTAIDVAEILKQSASRHGGWNPDTGYGVLDVAAAVARAQGRPVAVPAVDLGGTRSGLRVSLSWSSPVAVSYRLSVSRDGATAQTLLGPTTATGSSYRLDPGHSYSFTVTAIDAYGLAVASKPYVAVLPYSAVKVDLRASALVGRKKLKTRLQGTFNPAGTGVLRGDRKLALESFDGHSWHRFAVATTSRIGIATWTLTLHRGSYRIRARYAGAEDLAPATSRVVTLRVH
jgi:subtilisin family serine protease